MSTGLKANSDGSAAIQVGGTDVITLTSGGAATFVTSPTTVQAGTAAAPSITFSGDTNTGIYSPGADTVAIGTGGTERLRVDSAGNAGLGVTPAAWRTGSDKAFQIGAWMGLYTDSGVTSEITYNTYVNSSSAFVRLNTGSATRYRQYLGAHDWFTAGSSSAGSTITFTQAMTLDANGNLGIGTSSPSNKIESIGATPAYFGETTTNGTRFGYASALPSNSPNCFVGWVPDTVGGINGDLALCPRTSAGAKILFFTGTTTPSERARITSGGNLLVGSTTDDARLRVNGTAVVGRFVADGGGYANDVVLIDTSGTAAGTGFDLIQANAGGAGQFRVRGDGTLFAQNTTVQSISDQRVKENIRDADEGLAVVTALRPVRFDFKEGFGNDRKNQLGFIAQEIQQVFPDAVDVAAKEETDDEDAEPYKTVGAAALIPVLVKAIQEQQAMIDELKAKVAALEGA
jgi:hypothetical protein